MSYNNPINVIQNQGRPSQRMLSRVQPTDDSIVSRAWTTIDSTISTTDDFTQMFTESNGVYTALVDMTIDIKFESNRDTTAPGNLGFTVRVVHYSSSSALLKAYASPYDHDQYVGREQVSVQLHMSQGEQLQFQVYNNDAVTRTFKSTVIDMNALTFIELAEPIEGDTIKSTGEHSNQVLVTNGLGDFTYQDRFNGDASFLQSPTIAADKILVTNGTGDFVYEDKPDGVNEADQLLSTSQPVNKILVTDGADGFTYEDLPSGSSGGSNSLSLHFAEAPTLAKTTTQDPILFSNVITSKGTDIIIDGTDATRYIINTAGTYRINLQVRSTKDEVAGGFRKLQIRVLDSSNNILNNYSGAHRESDAGTTDTSKYASQNHEMILDINAGEKIQAYHAETVSAGAIRSESFITIEKLESTSGSSSAGSTVFFRATVDGTGQTMTSSVDHVEYNTIIENTGGGIYNPATGQYTIPEDGYYMIRASVAFNPETANDRIMLAIYTANSGRVSVLYRNDRGLDFPHVEGSDMLYLTAGDQVYIDVETQHSDLVVFTDPDYSNLAIFKMG